MRLLPLVLLAVHTIADPHQLQRARRSTVQPGACYHHDDGDDGDDGDDDKDGDDGMMILTNINELDDKSTSVVYDPKLDHLYDEDEIMTIDLCQVRRSPRSRLGTRTRSSGSQKRRQSSRRLSAWRPILEWPKISSFSLVGSFFVRFADIDDSFQSKVMV